MEMPGGGGEAGAEEVGGAKEDEKGRTGVRFLRLVPAAPVPLSPPTTPPIDIAVEDGRIVELEEPDDENDVVCVRWRCRDERVGIKSMSQGGRQRASLCRYGAWGGGGFARQKLKARAASDVDRSRG